MTACLWGRPSQCAQSRASLSLSHPELHSTAPAMPTLRGPARSAQLDMKARPRPPAAQHMEKMGTTEVMAQPRWDAMGSLNTDQP